MSERARAAQTTDSAAPARLPGLRRGCACGGPATVSGQCADCAQADRLGVQPKLTVNAPNDAYEQEADRIADRIVGGLPAGPSGRTTVGDGWGATSASLRREGEEEDEELQAKPADVQRQGEEEDDEEPIQAKRGPAQLSTPGPAFAGALDRETVGGAPLGQPARAFFEPRFGRDLSDIRLHDNARAAELSRQINARAFTHRRHIFFGAGQLDDRSTEGRRLLAHELTHTMQQGAAPSPVPSLQRQPAPPPAAPTAPTTVNFNFDPTIAIPAAAGGTAVLRATTDGTGVTWSIQNGTATAAAGTTIAANGTITLDAAQIGGSLTVEARNSAGFASMDFSVSSVPTVIDSTSVLSPLGNATTAYGAAFQHTFTSANGSANVLENLHLGERFPGAPAPTAAAHVFSGNAWPFGRGSDSFTLNTGTLANNGNGGFVLDTSGQFVAPPPGSTFVQGDNVGTAKSLIEVGDNVQSRSNPSPRNRLPVTLTLDQQFHFFNPRATGAGRWTQFTLTAHSRTLKISGSDVKFVTTVNGVENEEDYVGKPAVTNLSASPVNTPKSAGPPSGGGAAPAPKTVSLSVDTVPGTLPAGATLTWSIFGAALGCTVTPDPSDQTKATLTIGTSAGTVNVRVADSTGANFDQVAVRIT